MMQPEISAPNSFVFRKRHERVDWRKLASVNLEHVARDMDFHSLQENIMNITYCNIELELDLRLVDPNFIKLFKMAQLTIEYLLHSQDYLSETILDLENRIREQTKDEENQKTKMRKLEAEINRFKKEGHKRKKLLMEQQHLIDAGADNFHKCLLCPKAFMNITFLQNHSVRRHGQTIQDIQASRKTPQQEQMTALIAEQLTEIKERLAFTESQLSEERKSLREINARESVMLAERDDQHLKQLAMWQEERERQHKQEIEKIQNMLLTELREMQEKQSATQSALDAAHGGPGSSPLRQSNLGTLRDEVDVERELLQNERLQVEKQKEQLQIQLDLVKEAREKPIKETEGQPQAATQSSAETGRLDQMERMLHEQQQKMSEMNETYKRELRSKEKELKQLKKRAHDVSSQLAVSEDRKDVESVKRTLTFSDHVDNGGKQSKPNRPALTPEIKEIPPTESGESEEESTLDEVVTVGESTLVSTGRTFDEPSSALSTLGTLDMTAKSKELRDALIQNPRLMLDLKQQLKQVMDNELRRWDVDPGSTGMSSSKLNTKLQHLAQERRKAERKYKNYGEIRELIVKQIDEQARHGGSPPRATTTPFAKPSTSQPKNSASAQASRAPAAGSRVQNSLTASGGTDSWGTSSSKWTASDGDKVKRIYPDESEDEEEEEVDEEETLTGSETESEYEDMDKYEKPSQRPASTQQRSQTKPAAPSRPNIAPSAGPQTTVIQSGPRQPDPRQPDPRQPGRDAIKMPGVGDESRSESDDNSWDEETLSEIKASQLRKNKSPRGSVVSGLAATIGAKLEGRSGKAPVGGVNTLELPEKRKGSNTPVLQDFDDNFSISSIEDRMDPTKSATYSTGQWGDGSTVNTVPTKSATGFPGGVKKQDRDGSAASSLTNVTADKNESDSDWPLDSDLDI